MIDTTEHQRRRYSAVAIWLHWLMAAAIVAMIAMGLWMTSAIEDPERQAAAYSTFQWHKSLGLTVLVLALVRLAWRLTHPMPALPAHMPGWQQIAARISHVLLYVFMLAMPLTGWLYVSTGWNSQTGMAFDVPTVWFGLFQWPHLPGLSGSEGIANLAVEAHKLLAWGFIALLVVHVLGALKHHFADRDDVLWSMAPIMPRPEPGSAVIARDSE